MKFSTGVPNCREGRLNPIGSVDRAWMCEVAQAAEQLGYYVGTGVGYGIGVLSLILAPIIIFGAIRMMKGQSRGLGVTAAVLSLLPITCCSFPLGMIFGIWALVVLRNAEVQAYFSGENVSQFNSPQPPNWQ